MALYLGREKLGVTLPGGVTLPTLTNEGSASELFAGKELIDGAGNIVTGTFTIEEELATQEGLITQIQTALQSKAVGDSNNICPYTITVNSNYDINWCYAWNGEYKFISFLIPSLDGLTPELQSAYCGDTQIYPTLYSVSTFGDYTLSIANVTAAIVINIYYYVSGGSGGSN